MWDQNTIMHENNMKFRTVVTLAQEEQNQSSNRPLMFNLKIYRYEANRARYSDLTKMGVSVHYIIFPGSLLKKILLWWQYGKWIGVGKMQEGNKEDNEI